MLFVEAECSGHLFVLMQHIERTVPSCFDVLLELSMYSPACLVSFPRGGVGQRTMVKKVTMFFTLFFTAKTSGVLRIASLTARLRMWAKHGWCLIPSKATSFLTFAALSVTIVVTLSWMPHAEKRSLRALEILSPVRDPSSIEVDNTRDSSC